VVGQGALGSPFKCKTSPACVSRVQPAAQDAGLGVWESGYSSTNNQGYLGIDALLIGDWVIINLGRLRATYAVEGMARKKREECGKIYETFLTGKHSTGDAKVDVLQFLSNIKGRPTAINGGPFRSATRMTAGISSDGNSNVDTRLSTHCMCVVNPGFRSLPGDGVGR
jgi:hypothetical protein